MLNLYGYEPRTILTCLESDNMLGGDPGPAAEPSVEPIVMDNPEPAEPVSMDPEPVDYYHSITIPSESGDDEVLNFKDGKELNDKFLENYLRQSDYTKKTQSLAEQRKQFEQKEASFSERETALMRMQNQSSKYQELIEALPEAQFQKLLQEVQGKTPAPETDESRRLKAVEARYQAEDREKASVERKAKQKERFDARGRYLKSQLSDYDHEATMKSYDAMMNVSDEMVEQSVLEMLHYASKGKGAVPAPADPQGPARTRSGSGGIAPAQKVMSIEEGRLAALRNLPPRRPIV